jgi:Tol biopolymer transport system component
MSEDGRIITFDSDARNLIKWGTDTNNATDVFKYDRSRKTMSRVSVDWKGRQLNGTSGAVDISANGKVIVFVSNDWNAVSGGGNGHDYVYRRGRTASSIKLVDRNNHGQQGNAGAQSPSISASGKYIAYVSGATNFGADYNGKHDAFRTGPF